MTYFFEYSTAYVKILLIICLVIYIFYFTNKWTKTKLIFTPFNFQIIFFCVVIFLVSPFQYNYILSNTWSMFSTRDFIVRLNEAYTVNLLGFGVMGMYMLVREKKCFNSKGFCKMISFPYININTRYAEMFSIGIALVYTVYIINKAHGIPILNEKRFSVDTGAFVYYLLNAMTYGMAWYILGLFYQKKKLNGFDIFTLLLIIFSLFITGNRTPVLRILYAFFILILCKKRINYRTVFRQMKYVLLILAVGIFLIIMRNDSKVISIGSIFSEYIIYGSTFCDIRDGARVLWGYHNKYTSLLFGKIYLASILSFVPQSFNEVPILSSIAKFRQVYSGGTWSTYTLFGIKNHYGLRGGMFLSAYTNFGVLGIIIIAIILGYWFSNCDILFTRLVTHKLNLDMSKIMFSYIFINILFELLYAPGGFNSFWGYLIDFILLMCLSGANLKVKFGGIPTR